MAAVGEDLSTFISFEGESLTFKWRTSWTIHLFRIECCFRWTVYFVSITSNSLICWWTCSFTRLGHNYNAIIIFTQTNRHTVRFSSFQPLHRGFNSKRSVDEYRNYGSDEHKQFQKPPPIYIYSPVLSSSSLSFCLLFAWRHEYMLIYSHLVCQWISKTSELIDYLYIHLFSK